MGNPSRVSLLVAAVTAWFAVLPVPGWGQNNGFFRNAAVGGVSIDAAGVVAETTTEARQALRRELLDHLTPAPDALQAPVELRKVSLRGLNAALADLHKNPGGALPDEIAYLGGLQRVEYVLIYPEQNDIVLAGPGEGWTVDARGNVIGKTTGRPVLHLDDLLVALRTVDAARTEGLSCSIDPTAEGRQRLATYLSQQRQFSPAVVAGAAEALGKQVVTLTGVPDDSRFARTLVAADYRMKRLAMKLESAPGLPSYLDLVGSTRGAATPRWWLACDYQPLARSEDGLAFQLIGPGVQVLTEDEIVAADGSVRGAGAANAAAERFARRMTEQYAELSVAEPVFGELRNLMDLCVVSALIAKHDLCSRAGADLPWLFDTAEGAPIRRWHAPKSIASQSSFVKRGASYLITVSGGVKIESWQAASRDEVNPRVSQVHQKSTPPGDGWWWN